MTHSTLLTRTLYSVLNSVRILVKLKTCTPTYQRRLVVTQNLHDANYWKRDATNALELVAGDALKYDALKQGERGTLIGDSRANRSRIRWNTLREAVRFDFDVMAESTRFRSHSRDADLGDAN